MAKQYKTWELIKAWQEGERGQYVNECGNKITLERCGITYGLGNGMPVGLVKTNCESLWTKVQEPVDFMTAINSGKRIKPFQYFEYQKPNIWLKNIGYYDNYIEIINGKWLIEEE